jgi:hypothetical protein
MTIEETSVADLLQQLHCLRFQNSTKATTTINVDDDDKSNNVSDNVQISSGLKEILIGCLQVEPGT